MSKQTKQLKEKANKALTMCQEVMEQAFDLDEQNAQWYLSWTDALNKISTVW